MQAKRNSKSLSFTIKLFSKTTAHKNILMHTLEKRRVDDEYEDNAPCYCIVAYKKEVCEYRLFSMFSAEVSVLVVSKLPPRPALYELISCDITVTGKLCLLTESL